MGPTAIHAAIVIFLEYCVWGVSTSLVLVATKEAFGTNTLLLNGICLGIKGLLAFIFAPIIGEISDLYGRKKLLTPCVGFTCLPIVALFINYKLFFLLFVLSGIFNASFSLSFAYVSDCTHEKYRYLSYGLVSASFAASMIVSPIIGEEILNKYGPNALIMVAISIAIIDLLFLEYLVPESTRISNQKILSWSKLLNPFNVFQYVAYNRNILVLCFVAFLSSVAESGQLSSLFIYLKNVVMLSTHQIVIYMAICGFLSVISQTLAFNFIAYFYSVETALCISLYFQCVQLFIFGLSTSPIMIWIAGIMASISSIAFPCLSAMIAQLSSPEQQGIFQGLLNGVRGLCSGVGPAIFGLIFHLYGTNLDDTSTPIPNNNNNNNISNYYFSTRKGGLFYFPGIPYLVGSFGVALATYIFLYKSNRVDLYPKL